MLDNEECKRTASDDAKPTGEAVLASSGGSALGTRGICQEQSDKTVGWAVRRIVRVNGESVELNDGVSFNSACFSGARAGDIWAVCHEGGGFCFGRVRRAILLEPMRDVTNKKVSDER